MKRREQKSGFGSCFETRDPNEKVIQEIPNLETVDGWASVSTVDGNQKSGENITTWDVPKNPA